MASEAENFEQGCQSVDKRNVITVRVSPHDNDLRNSIIPIMLFFNSRMLEERTVRESMIGVVITRNRVSARPPHIQIIRKMSRRASMVGPSPPILQVIPILVP